MKENLSPTRPSTHIRITNSALTCLASHATKERRYPTHGRSGTDCIFTRDSPLPDSHAKSRAPRYSDGTPAAKAEATQRYAWLNNGHIPDLTSVT